MAKKKNSGNQSLFDQLEDGGVTVKGRRGKGLETLPPIPSSEVVTLQDAAQSRYLNYALSVITSRALPDVRDGLKPVQRRILFTMWQQNLTADAKHRKCAKVVGDVMGNYHPHGDSALYETLVRMAQSFSLRYPLVDGSGNFGSLDGDAAAAMRYTECRLARVSDEMLQEIDQDTVEFRPNYDGTREEPVVLPARIPNMLINGATGIAVGMATNIPPHNLREVCTALIKMIDADLEMSSAQLCRYIKGPDFPTGGQIINSPDEIRDIYKTGSGTIRLRATWTEGPTTRGGKTIFITSVPYMVNKATLIERIADVALSRKLPHLLDVKDLSTDDVRIALEIKKDSDPDLVMAYLYKNTPLQSNFPVNLTCLIPTENPAVGKPERLELHDILWHFLDFRFHVVTRRLEHELAALKQRIHILEGFETVFDALDEILKIVRKSEGKQDAAAKIMARFKLDAEQTDAILELKIYRLARLEIMVIQKELAERRKRSREIGSLLKSKVDRWKIIREEIELIEKTYGDNRRTEIAKDVVETEYSADDFIIDEDNVVVVTRDGWVKRQKEIKDIASTRTREGDAVLAVMPGSTKATVVFFSNFGAAYTAKIADIPASTGYGDPIQKLFKLKDGEKIVAALSLDPRQAGDIKTSKPETPPKVHAVAVSSNGFATVAGIVRPGFTGPDDQPGVLWAPFATYAALYGGAAIDPSSRAQVRVIARMPGGASSSAASDELTSVARSLPPAGFEGSSTTPEKTTGVRIERASRIEGPDAMGVYIVMAVLFVVLGLVLALACANVANLLLAGASTRAREFGVRIAMGASRPRLMRQLLSESLVIGAAAGAAGLLLSMWAVPLITRLVGLPMSSDVTLDRSVLLFTTLIAALSGVGAGLAPARYGSRSDVAGILKAQSLQAGASPQASRLRRGFIAFQAAASMLLLVTAALFFRSALHITQVDLGFDADRLIAVHVDFPAGSTAGEYARIAAYFRTAVERVSAVPSVERVSLALSPPFGPVAITNLKRNGTDYIIVNNRTDADYFRTAGFRIVRGRGYTREEVASVAPVALVSESLTREFYQGIEPIGASLAPVMVTGGEEITIIGVVADALVTHVRGGGGTTYRPIGPDPYATPQLIVRSSEPDHAIRDVEAALAPIDPSVRLSSTLMRESVTKFMNEPRVLAGLSGAVALLSLILSVLGIFGVTSFVVGQRTQEVSVRMAIGASAGDVVRLLIRQNMWPVVGGLIVGLAVALLGARAFTAQLFGISPYDPLAIVPAVVVLAGTALAAVAIPALRAARTDPASVLRT